MGEGERRVSVTSGRTCNVDRRASDFNVLSARLCNFRRERRDDWLRGVGQGQRRRRDKRVSGLPGAGQAQTAVEVVIAVERRDEFRVRRESANVVLRDPRARTRGEVGVAKRPREAGDLQGGVAPGRVDRPFGERLVDFAADRGEADAHRGRDLPVGIAGGDEVQEGLPTLDALRPAGLRLALRLGALGEG